MPGGNSGGGGETQQVRPPGYVEDALVNVLGRAGNQVAGGPSYGLYEGRNADRMSNLASIWGANPRSLAGAYGMNAGQFDAGMRTGVAPLTGMENRAIQRTNAWSESPISSLYGQAGAAAGDLMANGTGPWADAAARGMQHQLNDPLGVLGRQAWDQTARTAGGAYLSPDSNPYLRQTFNAAARQATDAFNTNALPALTSQFSASGRYGSGAQQNVSNQAAEDLQRNLGDMAANLYGNAYNQERGRQEAAIGQMGNLYGQATGIQQGAASQLGNLASADAQARGQASQIAPTIASAADAAQLSRFNTQQQLGAGMRGLQNQLLGSAASNYEGRVQSPYDQLSWYSNIINGVPGGLGTTSMQSGGQGGFNAGGAAGGALGGAMLGGQFGGPWGAAAGGLLGLGLGGFF